MPMPTSGHTGTNAKCSLNTRLHRCDCLWPPLKRTSAPNKQALMPSLSGSVAELEAVMVHL
jgi:hypothetical protein